ncbi:MAG: AAA family ATPase [Balneola sp.]
MKNITLSNGFRLISLELNKHKVFKSRIKYHFQDELDSHEQLYTTVIIGPNGTGKSNLLKVVIQLFRELSHLKQGLKRNYDVDGEFSLVYDFEGNRYEYSNIVQSEKAENSTLTRKVASKQAYYLKNGDEVDFYDIKLPEAIVANSIMLTDKYPVLRNDREKERFPIYHYLGVKNRPQQASTRSYVRKTVEFVVQQMTSYSFKECLDRVSGFLGLSGAVVIQYRTINTSMFFWGNLKVDSLKSYFRAIRTKYSKKDTIPPFKLKYFSGIENDDSLLQSICDYCNELKKDERLGYIYRSSAKLIRFDIIDDSHHKRLQKEYELLEHLRSLGMISTPEIKLSDGDEYSLEESSSGQYHFFSSMIGIIATAKPNSLIFIDEPEVSLHPNWQMQYLSFLRELLDSGLYQGCHVVIATHSHFLISDLKGKSSNIIGLKKTNNRIETVDLPCDIDTFGWSAEDVLYNVFDVSTTRNFYVAREIGFILKEISKKEIDSIEIEKKYKELAYIKESLKDSDPLKTLISKIEKEFL